MLRQSSPIDEQVGYQHGGAPPSQDQRACQAQADPRQSQGSCSINAVSPASQDYHGSDSRHDAPSPAVSGNGVVSEETQFHQQSYNDRYEQPGPDQNNGYPGAWQTEVESQNEHPDTTYQSYHSEPNEWRGANTEARDPYLYAGANVPKQLRTNDFESQNALAMNAVHSHSPALEPGPEYGWMAWRNLSRSSNATNQKLTKGQDRRSSRPGTIQSLRRKPVQHARPTPSTQAEVALRRTEDRILEVLRQLGDPLELPPRGSVTEKFLDWVPKEIKAWSNDTRALKEEIEILEGEARDAKHAAKTERDNAREARNYWEGQCAEMTAAAETLNMHLEVEKDKVAHGQQELYRSRGEAKQLSNSLEQVKTAHGRLQRHLENETRLLGEERREVQRLNNQLQDANATHNAALALLKDELDQERSSRQEDWQAHSRQLASQQSDFQQQREQEEKKHKQIERKQRQVIASHEVENYRPIGDDVFQLSFQTAAQTIGNLLVLVPQPSNLKSGATTEMDSTGFLARRMSVRSNGDGRPRGGGAKAWPRFLRSVCWRILVEGFFQDQPGFGVFGPEGDGYELLKNLREVFMQTTADGKMPLSWT